MFECVIFDGPHPVWSGWLTAEKVVEQAWHTLQGVDAGFFQTFVAFRGEETVLRTDLGEQQIHDFKIAEGL